MAHQEEYKTGECKTSANGVLVPFVVVHALCCGIPLLAFLLAVSDASLVLPGGAFVALGLVALVWRIRPGCATCQRNEARQVTQHRSALDQPELQNSRDL